LAGGFFTTEPPGKPQQYKSSPCSPQLEKSPSNKDYHSQK